MANLCGEDGFISHNEHYPFATKTLISHRESILTELLALLDDKGGDGRKWGVWAAEDYDPPKFTLLTPDQILERQESVVEDPEREKQWSLYGLYLYCDAIERGCLRCPMTADVLASIPGLINAGFSCLGPHSETGWHEDVDRGFDRLHLPLIIPDGDCGFTVGTGTKRWKDVDMLGFDDTFYHNAWNHTHLARYVLLVDIERCPARAALMKSRLSNTVVEARSVDQNFFSWKETFPFLEEILQQSASVREEWQTIKGTSHTIDSPETSYDINVNTWKNFWMVHTFPADRPELTTWIDENCELVPKTTALLQKIPGIRDAFFSELGPGVVLDEHFGYADQSNFVLRCHIPLIVPDHLEEQEVKETRPCYVECDGERRYHTLQDVIVFDDSKLHSAGNLSSHQSRTVLIIDIDRPSHVKLGTSSSCISREMLSHWCEKVYPLYDADAVKTIVEHRIPFCRSFLEEHEVEAFV